MLNGNIDNPANGGASFPPAIYSLPLKYKSPTVYNANMDVQQHWGLSALSPRASQTFYGVGERMFEVHDYTGSPDTILKLVAGDDLASISEEHN